MTDEQAVENTESEVVETQMDQATLDAKLDFLKGIDLSDAVVNVYVNFPDFTRHS